MDIVGKRFGDVVVQKYLQSRNGHRYCRVLCDCGGWKIIAEGTLLKGRVKSCGCKGDFNRKINHGLCSTNFYRIWHAMKQRCGKYKNYKDIKVCNEWIDFKGFMNDMYKSYLEHIKKFGRKETLLDRINGKGDYCKDNCRWATRIEQNRNMRTNVNLTFNGKTQCVAAWAKELGYNPRFLEKRLIMGWSVERTLSTPPLWCRTKSKNLTKWSQEL